MLPLVGVVLAAQSTPTGKPQKPRIKPATVHFEDIAQQVGLCALDVYGNDAHKEILIETTGNGAVIFDYDNDSWPDIYLPNGPTAEGFPSGKAPRAHLYHNNRGGTFPDVTGAAGLGHRGWGQGACVGDYDNDGYLDLSVTYWGQSVLYHNNGDGTFSDVSEKAGLHSTGACCGLTSLTVDFDHDEWRDIYVACDSTASLLNHNNHDGTFVEIGKKAGVAFNEDGLEQAGMGQCADDFSHSGFQDMIRTNFSDDTPTLYLNQRSDNFDDVTERAGPGKIKNWLGGCSIFDFDNSGWPGILIANGHVYPEVEGQGLGTYYREPKVAYYNLRDGTFENITDRCRRSPERTAFELDPIL